MKVTRGRTVIIFVPWIGPSMNKIWAGCHWSARKKIADAGHKAVIVALSKYSSIALGFDENARPNPFTGPVSLEYTPYHAGRHYDLSNYAVTCKAIEDGLVLSGFLSGDSQKVVRRMTINPTVRVEAKETRMEVKIVAMEVEA